MKIRLYLSTSTVGSAIKEEFDLIDDWAVPEEELKGKSDEEVIDMLKVEINEWVWSKINLDVRVIKGDESQ
jgi:hypothetical protein